MHGAIKGMRCLIVYGAMNGLGDVFKDTICYLDVVVGLFVYVWCE